MKLAFVVLAVFLIAGSAFALTPAKKLAKSAQTKDEESNIKRCLKGYDLSEELANLEKISELIVDLNEQQKGCYEACLWRGYGWMKPDGTIDFDDVFEGSETTREGRLTRRTYEIGFEGCRAAAGQDDCRFFNCFNRIKVPMVDYKVPEN